MNQNNPNLISNYWKTKLLNREINIGLNNKNSNVSSITINSDELIYFNKLSNNNSVAQFTVISSIYNFLLKRLITEFDGFLVSNFENQSNPLVLSLPIDLNISFKDYLQSVKSEILETLNHADFNKEIVAEKTGFEDFWVLSNYGININSNNKLSCNGLLFDIKINHNKDLEIQASYLDGFINPSIVGYLVQHFKDFLIHLENNIEVNLSQYSLLTDTEKQHLLVDFNNTEVDYPKNKTIVDLFEEQVVKTPNNIAVLFQESSLTFKELNEKSNQLAYCISSEYTINKGDIVGVFLPKSNIGIISYLAILKLGAVYLPIDTHYPQERIDYLIKDSGLKLLIGNGFDLKTANCDILNINDVNLEKYSSQNIYKEISSKDLAYIIYTSGSTGQPKGVMIEHTSNVNMSLDQIRSFNITKSDKVVWFASVSFDASISEIMMCLYSGATLCIPSEETIKDKNEFVRFLKETKSTVVTFPPSYLGLLNQNEIFGLRCIITAGESANSSKALEIAKSGIDYYNAYGPTECAVCVSIYKVNENDIDKSIIPIGTPIANTQVYILDEALQPLPIGVSGKIYVSGAGVARGYLNKSELTNEKFISNPFIEGTRMYDTGDLGCWLSDGNIEFLGRKDSQVKLRGYRIELGEIENTILQFSEDIKQVVVEVKENITEKVLVAYFVSTSMIDKSELRSFLQRSLPEYMLPSFYVELEKLPLTPNGKIDRKALPSISENDVIRKEYAAPTNKIEEILVSIWQEVLGIDIIGVSDNFFELGGHSLMIGQVINKIYKQLSKTISFKIFFANPTIKALGKQLKKREYLPIPKAREALAYPLTASQSRLWILSQLEGGSLAYNMPAAVKLTGVVNFEKFEESFQLLIQRHEILRTYFKSDEEGEVEQCILPFEQFDFKIETKDFGIIENQDDDVAHYLEKINSESFNLEKAPLIRAALIKLKEEEFIFFLSLHHIIGDGWSIELLISEVVKTYNDLIAGRTINLPELSIQYKDYAVWLNGELQQDQYLTSENYLLQKFQGELPVLDLPSFKKRPLVQTYHGDAISHQFSATFLEKLKIFSKEQDVTLFMTLMSGIKTLLYRYTSQDDIIVGTPIAGRKHPDLENQMGLFLNTLPIRTQFKEKISFLELLTIQKDNLLAAYDNQNYPFDALVGKLNLKRNTSRSALFDVLVVLQNQNQLNNLNNAELSNIGISDYEFKSKTAQLDVSFTFVETEELGLTIEYNTDIYDKYLIERMFTHFENLLQQLIKNPEREIQGINYLTIAEKHQVLVDFNDTQVDYPKDKTIIDLFEEQVEKTPNNIAVIFDEVQLTYKELNEKANQLGAYLRENNRINPDDLIGIKLGRSEQMIVVILGILKSGAAYVPIDPTYPEERIAYIEKDSSAKRIIDEQELEKFYKNQEKYAKSNILKINNTNDLAYVIYTSGTTGNPKGVMVEHKSVVSIYQSWKTHYELDKIDVNLLQLASISFDVFVGDICRSILNGGKMIICSNDVKLNPEHLFELMQKQKISILEGTPSLLLPLMDYIIDESKDYSFLKILIFGSDNFNNIDYNRLKDKLGKSIKIINSYGVTEATIDSTYYDNYKKDLEASTPIGKPFSNTKIQILDSEGSLVPTGVYGELFIGGDGLARGYFNNEDLTSKKFIENQFEKGKKLYKTGDLARWLSDGNIDFLGRNDNQVKIRGYRIELGEIESVLQKNEVIKSCVLSVKSNSLGEKNLVAYLVSNEVLVMSEIKSYLKGILPDYMIPNYFIQINTIPITPNGKIDRKSLPNISGYNIIRKEYIAPTNKTEEVLVAIWQEVLGIDTIGITDNFFELGGHSLKVTKLLNQINKEFEIKVSFQDLFSNMILEEQAKIIAKAARILYNNIPKATEQFSYVLSSSQQRLWLLSQFEGGNEAYNMPSVFEIKGDLSISNLEKAFTTLINRHESLRTVFKEVETGEIRQFILNPDETKFKLQYEDLTNQENVSNNLKEIVQKETTHAFDLSSDSLLRAKLVKIAQDNYIFICVMHHIISDGWSTEIMTNELFSCYEAFITGKPSVLPTLEIQYKDFAEWQQNKLKKEHIENHKVYWLNQFKGEIPVLDLPTYQTRPLIKTYNGKSIKNTYQSAILKDFNKLCQSQGSTLFMGLLATVKILLYRYTNQTDIILGSPIAGREHVDLQNQIGFYVNTLVLRTEFDDKDNFEKLLTQVKEVTLGAYEHQVYPFDELVEQLQLKRDLTRNPLFDVMVTFQNTDNLKVNTQELEAISIKEYKTGEEAVSKVDIEFIFDETVNGLNLILVYNTDLYSTAFATSILSHFEVLLQSIVLKPEVSLNSINYLTEEERQQVLVGFNDTKVDYPKNKTVLDLFKEQVEKYPGNIALQDDIESYSYSELDKLSNQIAQYFITTYGKESICPIAILLGRSANMVVMLLGILKSGRSYIPLDPTFPKERLNYILHNSQSKILIIEKEYELDQVDNVTINTLESILDRIDGLSDTIFQTISSEDTAYIIYTSGSTGNPKGVEIGHQSLLNFLTSIQQKPRVTANDKFFSVTTYSFDISILEFFVPLISGATLYIANQEVLSDSDLIIEKLREVKPTIIQATPSFYQMLFHADWQGDKHLKVLCGGDLLSESLAEKLINHSSEVWNMYGPTETTIWSSVKKIEQASDASNIGKPINNTQFYILDELLNAKPIGTVGSIYIAGDGLAKGYYKNESLTKDKFIQSPFDSNRLLYETGDLGKWNSNGEIEFLGRNDNQVKIRGYRIELGDIENALLTIPQIDEAITITKTDNNGGKLLVAYLTSQDELNIPDIKSYLKEILPEYMIPSYFIKLDGMPLTPNGKIDRKVLSHIENLVFTTNVEYVAPVNEIQEKLVNLWEQLLGIKKISIKANFFDLGGNSLSATRLISLIHKEFDIKISINELFKNMILEEQADFITNISLIQSFDLEDSTIEKFTI
jgi:amino acid adenylation domain-containing protein